MAFHDPDALKGPDADSQEWVTALTTEGAVGEKARRDLHLLLLGAARHEIRRRRESARDLSGGQLEDHAHDSADRALAAIRASLDRYLGGSHFTTWAYKFAVIAAAAGFREPPETVVAERTCEQCLGVVDVYVEIEVEGGEAEAVIPKMGEHLAACSACAEVHASLLELVERDSG